MARSGICASAGILDADGNTSLVVERYPEGEEAGVMRPGDFVVTHGELIARTGG